MPTSARSGELPGFCRATLDANLVPGSTRVSPDESGRGMLRSVTGRWDVMQMLLAPTS
jgi:hypothetical protein